MIDSVVTFKWDPFPGYRSHFTSEHVNRLRQNFGRFYPEPHRFICITDDGVGLDSDIEAVPLWDEFSGLRNPTWPAGPNCFRRLPAFGKQFREIAGDRFMQLDIDIVFTGDLRPIVNRTEPFVIWGTSNMKIPYCASMILMTAGCHAEVYEKFDPSWSPATAHRAGYRGSDQAWINFVLGKKIPTWTTGDGVFSYNDHIRRAYRGDLPRGARAVIFHGKPDPWDVNALSWSPWIREFHEAA